MWSEKGIKVIVAKDLNRSSAQILPSYYSGQWMRALCKPKTGVRSYMADSIPCSADASFVLFYNDENLQMRDDSMKREIPAPVYETIFNSGLIDEIMQKLNPVNKNETIYMYRNNDITKLKQ